MNQFHALITMKRVSLICNLCGTEVPVPGLRKHTDLCKPRIQNEFGIKAENRDFEEERKIARDRFQILLEYGEKFAKELRENSEKEMPEMIGFHQNL